MTWRIPAASIHGHSQSKEATLIDFFPQCLCPGFSPKQPLFFQTDRNGNP